jgi:sphingomyelin phosphodiesterase acid-like 3
MRSIRRAGLFRVFVFNYFLAGLFVFFMAGGAELARAQSDAKAQTVPALFVSDIHLEPFWDLGKAARLAAVPVAKWNEILAAPDTADREKKFQELQQSCHARGEDTSYALLESSLRAMQAHASDAKFVTLSGDLISHSFSCKYARLFPNAAPGDYRAFVEKTVEFVVQSLRTALPGAQVYVALGNNDSDCGDYQLDANSEFLAQTGKMIAKDFPAAEREEAERDFAVGGYFGIRLPAPIENTRLLVLNDSFMSRRYQTCIDKEDPAPAAAQIAWLEQQLDEARRNKGKVWVMGHIPPGVDAYSTATNAKDICNGGKPTMFLSSETLPEVLAQYGDVIRLVIFAHTHMDEMRLLEPAKTSAVESGVAVKLVASISPIDGNNPSFTVAQIEPRSAALKDYRVFVASNQTGVDAGWEEEYDYAKTYHEPDFTATSVKELIGEFDADATGQSSESQSFMRNFGTGMGARELNLFWPQYVCALKNDSGEAFGACVCSSKP